uniref:Transmembrane protein 144b n=1 Tax=Nothobranchius furzeri TaxID=105023 RepID=A0A8C6KAQ3_NOTFU
ININQVFIKCIFLSLMCSDSMGCGKDEICKLDSLNFFSNSTNVTFFAYGLTANIAAVLLYGSTFVPVKKIETGDGMFYNWVSCASIWVVAMLGDIFFQSPKFHPLAMLGGAIWATGSVTVVTIVKAIGLGLGILIWGSSSLLMGWASSRFGWFGIDPQDVSKPVLNYCGAALCLVSGMIFVFVKSDVKLHLEPETVPLLIERVSSYSRPSAAYWIDAVGPKQRRIIGCLLAVVSGLLYGCSFVPILYIKNHSMCPDSAFYGASDYDVDYVPAQTSGVFVASTVYFTIYCAVMKSKPRVYSRVILPGFLSGLMWTVGTYSWFLANNYLTSVITFPIVTAGYGLVAALWGSLVFREIKVRMKTFIFHLFCSSDNLF